MIGRGAVQNPGIFRQIKTGRKMTKNELYDFLKDLYETYERDYGEGNALSKMKEVWSYTVRFVPDEKDRSRIFKTIIKSNNVHRYNDAIMVAFNDLDV
jgi:tRNA-dihydrouridine synthase